MTGDAPEDQRDLVGQTLMGKLKVLRLIGAGGMGAVYEVEHLLTRHHRALKLLHKEYATSAEVVARFVREAGVAGTLRSEHVVETFDAGQLEDGSAYVLMELLEGRSLAALLEERRRLAPAHAARLVWQACEGVATAHDAGIVHRDLKPDNLFVVRRADGQETVKLLDFGISKFTRGYEHSGTLTSEGSMMGTPYYMSPEQAKGAREVDERADIYALGVILYEAVTGLRPFDDTSFPALVIKIYQGQYRPLIELCPDLDPAFAAVVERAMHVDPDQRFPSARELQDALRPFVDEPLPVRASMPAGAAAALEATLASEHPAARASVPTPRAPGPTAAPSGGGRRTPLLIGVALAGVGLVLGVVALSLGNEDPPAEPPVAAPADPGPPDPAAGPAPPAPEPAPVPEVAVDRATDAGAHGAEPEQPAPPKRTRAARSRRGGDMDAPSRAQKAGLDTDNPYGD